MHIGLFFGSFNPVHIGHMALANYMLSYTNMQQVWLVVSPQNPLKDKSQLLDQQQRLNLVRTALDDHPNLRASTIEFGLSQPSYTINTLAHLKEKYPEHEFSLIMGQDNLRSFHKWKNYEEILKQYQIYVYPRPGADSGQFANHPHVHLTDAPVIDISSTFIRNAIRDKKDVRFFLPAKVWEEIDGMNYYRK
ncbi:MAG: nicotinate (nicotinamide) nucleotide adenylyltransferase [bacterium]|nr:nicotinate (nicotinamide) nucleotide adenylyltransferase [bacterium]